MQRGKTDYHGYFTRVQTDNLPSHPTGAASDPLPIDRLGHHAAFCYDTHTSIIAIQFDIKMAIGRVCKYAASFAEGTKFVAMPVLRQDALARFENETPTKFTVRVAKVHHFTDSVTGATDFEEAIDGMGALFEAPNVQITVSARGSGGGLDRDSVLTTIRRYLGFSQEFEGIKSVTAETAESPDAFNFLKCLLKQSEMLDLPRNDPSAGRAV